MLSAAAALLAAAAAVLLLLLLRLRLLVVMVVVTVLLLMMMIALRRLLNSSSTSLPHSSLISSFHLVNYCHKTAGSRGTVGQRAGDEVRTRAGLKHVPFMYCASRICGPFR